MFDIHKVRPHRHVVVTEGAQQPHITKLISSGVTKRCSQLRMLGKISNFKLSYLPQFLFDFNSENFVEISEIQTIIISFQHVSFLVAEVEICCVLPTLF